MKIRNYGLLFVVTVTVAVLSSCGGGGAAVGEVKKVRVAAASSGGVTSVQYPGRVSAADDVNMSFRVGGTIERYYVEEGQSVRHGQLLAALDATDYRVQLDATEAEYRQAKAQADRIIALYHDSVVTPNDYDQAVYGMQQMSAKLQNHRDMLSYTRLYAPFDGTVNRLLYDSHETVGAGTPVISMVGGGDLEIEVDIPAADYVARREGDAYSCTFAVYPGETYPLTLIGTTPKTNANQLYTMRLKIDVGGRPAPAPGMSGMVTVSGEPPAAGESAATVRIPSTAVLNVDGSCRVYVYDGASSVVSLREVEVLRLSGDGTCTVRGIAPGDTVVTSGVRHIADGDRVEPIADVSDTNIGGLL